MQELLFLIYVLCAFFYGVSDIQKYGAGFKAFGMFWVSFILFPIKAVFEKVERDGFL